MPDALADVERAEEQARVGAELQNLFLARDLTQVQVARRMGIQPESLSRFLNGRRLWRNGPEDFGHRVRAAVADLTAGRVA